jgi:hypothetical protein
MWHIDNSVHLRSCIRDVNTHLWCRCQGESQYLISIDRLHGIILCSLISLIDLSAALWLFMVFIGKYRSRLSSPGSFGSKRLSINFMDHHRHTNPHRWLPRSASTISQLCPVQMSGLVQRRTSELAVSNINELSSTWCSKAHSAARPQRILMLIFSTSWRSATH